MANKKLLNISSIKASYINTVVFDNLSFELHEGENYAVLSNEEAQNSNFLKLIAGHFNLTKGTIDYCFYDAYIKKYPPDDPLFNFRHLIAFVAQKHNFKNRSNTREFYYQQRYNSSDAEDTATVKDFLTGIEENRSSSNLWGYNKIVETLKLENLTEKHLIKLSNGETKRLLIAAALLKNPVVLLLDHPFTGLDVEMRKEMNLILKEIAQAGTGIIIATTQNEIPDVITHIAVLKNGGISKTVLKRHFDLFAYEESVKNNFHFPDRQKLKSLLEKKKPEKFNTIASLNNVNVNYGGKPVLQNVSWHIKQGEHWAVLGPNGAGKTTLLSLINGDNPQSYANDIVLFDRKRGSGESIWDIKARIGFVSPELFQYFPLNFTCIQAIESGFYDSMGLYRKSNQESAAIALEWMLVFEIEDLAHKKLAEVPPNIQRLCMVIRALVKSPALLILDEPCQGLGLNHQLFIKEILETIGRESKTTMIYVTHYQEEIPDCINKVLRLNEGKLNSDQ